MNSTIFSCFLDASKAFDRVNHDLLFSRLRRRGVPSYIVRILIFWYQHQRVCVRWGSVFSEFFNVTNGVRQGGILSPYLFNVYMDDLSLKLNACKTGCMFNGLVINHLMYADDLVIFSPSVTGLKMLIDACEQFGNANDVKYNSLKSCLMTFRCNKMKQYVFPKFYLNNNELIESDCVKYLGHYITNDLRDDIDIQRQIKKLYAQGNILLRKFHMCSVGAKVLLFRSYCSSLYACQLWWKYNKSTINKLNVTYHNVLKMFIGVPKFESSSLVCSIYNVQCCQSVRRNLIYNFMRRVSKCNNSVIVSLISSSLYFTSEIRNHWYQLLHL